MEKINVGLYGGKGIFGGRETPLTAKIIFCDKCEQCELYKESKCLNVVTPFSASCIYGKVENIKGYTSRAAKYYDFRRTYTEDDKYNKLKYPQDFSFLEIGDYYVVNIKHTRIRKMDGSYEIDEPFMDSSVSFILKEDFTVDLLKRIAKFMPQAFLSNKRIRDNKSVDNFLAEVQKKLPDLYDNFIKDNPQYADVKTDYVGRYAYINTLVDGSELIDVHNNKFLLKDGYLYCGCYRSSFLPFNSHQGELKIKVTDEMKYRITSNDQVNENTKFV